MLKIYRRHKRLSFLEMAAETPPKALILRDVVDKLEIRVCNDDKTATFWAVRFNDTYGFSSDLDMRNEVSKEWGWATEQAYHVNPIEMKNIANRFNGEGPLKDFFGGFYIYGSLYKSATTNRTLIRPLKYGNYSV